VTRTQTEVFYSRTYTCPVGEPYSFKAVLTFVQCANLTLLKPYLHLSNARTLFY